MLPHKHWKEWLFPLALVVLTVLICALNYSAGTWLTGWDTLHPELDFSLNFSRLISGVWRGDQGLGAVAAHAHMSELPRVFILWVMSLALPLSFVRYAYIFLCFILGPLGVYFFCRSIFKHRSAAFIASLIYIFNLATVQQFIVIFEMFAVQYAALGWLFLAGHHALLDAHPKKWLRTFATITLLSTPMAYASTLWLATSAGLGLYLLSLTMFAHNKKTTFRLLQIGLVLFFVNAFWLLPNLYFLLSPAHTIPGNSHINQLFSQEAFLQNQEFGTFLDLAVLRNFLFQWQVYDFETQKFVFLLKPWADHLKQPLVLEIGFFLSFTAIVGAGLSYRKKQTLALLPPFFLTIFMLINANPPFLHIFEWLRTHSGLFEEGFRFPFTKFSFLYVLCFSIFVATSIDEMLTTLKKYRRGFLVINVTVLILASSSLLYFGWPMFQGQLISTIVRQRIPNEYFELFSVMRSQPHDAKLAVLPAHTPAGWEYKKWGYQGAGFLWFGMPQAMLVRDFDRWNPNNEMFYEKISTAIYGQNTQAFEDTITQYQVQYLLIDTSLFSPTPGGEEPDLYLSQIESQLSELKYEVIWQQNFLTLYKTPVQNQLVATEKNAQLMAGTTARMRQDPLYDVANGSYVEKNTSDPTATQFPFSNLKSPKVTELQIDVNQEPTQSITITSKLPASDTDRLLQIPQLATGQPYTSLVQLELNPGYLRVEFLSQNTITYGSQVVTLPQLPPITVDVPTNLKSAFVSLGNTQTKIGLNTKKTVALTLTAGQPITTLVFDAEQPNRIDLTSQFSSQKMEECWRGLSATAFSSVTQNEKMVKVRSKNTSNCQSLYLTESGNTTYLAYVQVPFFAEKNSRPYFCLVSQKNNYSCLNDPEYDSGMHRNTWSTASDYITLTPNDHFWLDLKLLADPNPDLEQIISYQKPTVLLYPLATFAETPVTVWEDLQKPTPILLKASSERLLKLNVLTSTKDVMGNTTTYFQNCEPNNIGEVQEIPQNNGFLYTSLNSAIGCKAFYLNEISQQSPHLIAVSGKNLAGRSLKMYLYNQSNNHLDLEEMLPSGNYTTYFSVLNWPKIGDGGYTLSLENRAFGRLSSENLLTSLKILTFPIDWISRISVSENEKQTYFQKVDISNIQKITGFFSIVHLSSPPAQNGLLIMNQAYDSGWIAFSLDQPLHWLGHVTYNGWANAWILNNSQAKTIIIFFWPQLLEIFGFILLPLAWWITAKDKRSL